MKFPSSDIATFPPEPPKSKPTWDALPHVRAAGEAPAEDTQAFVAAMKASSGAGNNLVPLDDIAAKTGWPKHRIGLTLQKLRLDGIIRPVAHDVLHDQLTPWFTEDGEKFGAVALKTPS